MHESQQTFADSRCWTCALLKWVWGDGEVSQIWSAGFPTVMERNKDISIAAELSSWRRHKAPVVGRSSQGSPAASSAPAHPNTVFSLSFSVRLTDKFTKAELLSFGASSVFPDSVRVRSHSASSLHQTNQAAKENTCKNTGIVTLFLQTEFIYCRNGESRRTCTSS